MGVRAEIRVGSARAAPKRCLELNIMKFRILNCVWDTNVDHHGVDIYIHIEVATTHAVSLIALEKFVFVDTRSSKNGSKGKTVREKKSLNTRPLRRPECEMIYNRVEGDRMDKRTSSTGKITS
jgi:hypothetical protein